VTVGEELERDLTASAPVCDQVAMKVEGHSFQAVAELLEEREFAQDEISPEAVIAREVRALDWIPDQVVEP
jgi:hypothetical protein